MVEVERDSWRSSCLPPPLMQSHLQLVVHDHVLTFFAYLQGWRLRNLPGQPVSVFSHVQGKEVFLEVQEELQVFQFVPIDSDPVTWHH